MKQILMIEASPRGASSASRTVAEALGASLAERHPSARLVRRDIAGEQLPLLDDAMVQAMFAREVIGNPGEVMRLSDQLTDELLASDLLVIATPMWNFGIPASLKAWIDLVVRPGRTFHYALDGVHGLAADRKAILVIASGGVFSEGPWQSWDHAEPYLRQVLRFIGIENVETIRVEGMNIPDLASDAVPRAIRAADAVAL